MFITILLLGFSLAIDAFTVSITDGMRIGKLKFWHCLLVGGYFGVFQFGMTALGYLLCSTVFENIVSLGNYIAFGLLLVVGLNMVFAYFKNKNAPQEGKLTAKVLSPKNLIPQAIATSIDAFAVGVSLTFTDISLWQAATGIGIIALLLSMVGVFIGKKIGNVFKTAELWAGIVIIILAFKTLIDSLLLK